MDSKPEQGRNETNIQSDDGALANPPSSASNVIPQATIVSDFPAEKGAQGNEFCATGVYPGPAPVYPPPTSVATPSPHLQAADGVVDRLLHLVDELHDRKENRRYDRDLRHEELRERLRIEREQRHNVPASQGYLGIAPGYPMTAPGQPPLLQATTQVLRLRATQPLLQDIQGLLQAPTLLLLRATITQPLLQAIILPLLPQVLVQLLQRRLEFQLIIHALTQ